MKFIGSRRMAGLGAVWRADGEIATITANSSRSVPRIVAWHEFSMAAGITPAVDLAVTRAYPAVVMRFHRAVIPVPGGRAFPSILPNEAAVSESEESTPSQAPWMYRMWMHARARCICFVLWLLGQDYTEIRDLLAENRRLRKQLNRKRVQDSKSSACSSGGVSFPRFIACNAAGRVSKT